MSRKQRLLDHLKRFALSFTSPHRFREYWLSRAGAIRIAKLAGAFVLFILAVFIFYIPSLPKPGQINSKIGQTTTFYSRDAYNATNNTTDFSDANKLYEIHNDQNRVIVDFNTIPQNLKNATIAIEDHNFYKEGAFSVVGTLRALYVDVTNRGAYQGGSTITQQYVKNALLTNQTSVSRKIKELILSIEINQFYSKDKILGLYLNEIPYSNGAYGIEAACRTYFSDRYGSNNCTQHLDLGESALLASIPNLPSYFNPYGQNKQDLLDRQHVVLDEMAKQGYVTQKQADAAKWTIANLDTETPNNASLAINKEPTFYSAITAPNFVLTLESQLEAKYGTAAVDEGGWKVITTLDRGMQTAAEKSIYNVCNPTDASADHSFDKYNKCNAAGGANYQNLESAGGSNGAMVAADPNTGQVYAMVGSYNFSSSQVNVATSLRQPGSSFKPYVYANLLSKNKNGCTTSSSSTTSCATYGGGSILSDSTTDFGGGYTPSDFDQHTRGPVTMRTALAGSLNIPAVQALQLGGVQATATLAKSMGITQLGVPGVDDSNYTLPMALGANEVKLADHVNAYEAFANGGLHYQPTMSLKIFDKDNKVIEDNTKPKTPTRVLDAQVAYIIANMMSDAPARTYAFGNLLSLSGFNGTGLTGTGVAVKTGTTTNYKDAWTMGYTPKITVGVWAGNNDGAQMTTEAADISAPIWRSFMLYALNGSSISTFSKPSGIQTLTVPGSAYVSDSSTNYKDLFPSWYKGNKTSSVIDKVSKLLATSCTPALAKETVAYAVSGNDNVHSCDDAQPTASISVSGGSAPYTATITVAAGKFTPNKLDVYLDDQVACTQAISGAGTYSCQVNPNDGASHAVKAVVTDDGYYQGTSDTDTIGGGSSGFYGTTPGNGATTSAGPVSFTWSAAQGATSYQLYIDGVARGTSTPSTSETYPVTTKNVTHTWFATSSNGLQTSPISFTVQ